MPVAELNHLEEVDAIDFTVHDLPQGYELIDGQLMEKPAMSFANTMIAGDLFIALHTYFKSHPIGVAVPPEASYQCFPHRPEQIRKPDASAILCEPVKFQRTEPHGLVVPAVVVEVVSKNEKHYDLEGKIDDFLKAGTRLVWVVNPERRRVTVHYPDLTTRVVLESGTLSGEDVLPGFALPVASILPPV
jgi:Uma2 family endonuclease